MDEGADVVKLYLHKSREQARDLKMEEEKKKTGTKAHREYGGKTKLVLAVTNLTAASTERSDGWTVPDAANFQVNGYITDKRPELLLNEAKDDASS